MTIRSMMRVACCYTLMVGVMCGLVLTAAPAFAQEKGEWVNISEPVTTQLVKDGKKIGYPGLTAGVVVDPASGDVYMVICDNGLWKSSDQGKSFARVDGGAIGGRCETGYTLSFDPAGKRLACFMVYGSSASTQDGGKTFTAWKTSHVDFGAVDWDHTGKAYLTRRHEAGDVLCLSTDAGATWTDLGRTGPDKKIIKEDREYNGLGMFDAKTLMATRAGGFLRSTDAGKTWNAVAFEGDIAGTKPVAPLMQVRKGIGYWCTDKGIVTSSDQGATWTRLSEMKAVFGPMFGKDESHFVIVNKDGFHETKDGGKKWMKAAPLPAGFTVGQVGHSYAWDAGRDLFYASTMGKPTFRFER